MSAGFDILRQTAEPIVAAEKAYACVPGRSIGDLAARQVRIKEIELAARLRAGFSDIDTYLNAQGRGADRDIVSDSHRLEVEVKYACGVSVQHLDVAIDDWRWFLGLVQRNPSRAYKRAFATFFPTAELGFNIQSGALVTPPSRHFFQKCFSATPSTTPLTPFLPVAKVVEITGKEPKAQFREDWEARSVIELQVAGTPRYVRTDVVGSPFDDLIWCVLHEEVDAARAQALVASGFIRIDGGVQT